MRGGGRLGKKRVQASRAHHHARCVDRVDAVARRTRGGPAAGQRSPTGPNQGETASPEPADRGSQRARAGQEPPPGQPVFRAGINFVRVDVIATDNKGNPILDLKPEDLAVTEDGKPQAIESFKLIKVTGGRRRRRRARFARASMRSPKRSAKTFACSPFSWTTITCAGARRCMRGSRSCGS